MRYRIGIDLGTTNCALASVLADEPEGRSSMLEIPQPETAHSTASHPTLPSFLYLPPGAASQGWLVGRWPRTRAAEVPGRVVSSAKSWMVHHAADRRANFLPLGTSDIPPADQLSPVHALATLLRSMGSAWDAAHPDAPLCSQDLAITVPASFDPLAQQLTLEAAREAGFPASTILIEEPQAAFYAWMENAPEEFARLGEARKTAHVLVVDIGGGTTDFSLFAIEPSPGQSAPHLNRIAVSNHLLLGGDNLDLALAHFLEGRLAPDAHLPTSTFAQLLARCREIKEEMLGESGVADQIWPVAVASPETSLLSGTLRCEISASEISRLVLEGFFPDVGARERPLLAVPGLREMGLPYAKDPAVTRHLADFLRERPAVDFLLFNGGLTKASSIRQRILDNLTRWQDGLAPRILENPEPDLAVARGAARYLYLRAKGDSSQIEAGAAHSYYISVGAGNILCVLPQGTPSESACLAGHPGLRARIGNPASFPLYSHARRQKDREGDIINLEGSGVSDLPSIETILSPPAGSRPPKNPNIRVKLRTTLRSTGLLRVELLCAEPSLKWEKSWPLEFSLRSNPCPSPSAPAKSTENADAVSRAAAEMSEFLSGTRKWHEKLTANAVFSIAEKSLGLQKPAWTGAIVRQLFDSWMARAPQRLVSPEHEETWLQIAGYLLRPGCGMAGDAERVESLATILSSPPNSPGGSVKIQRWIASRRIAAGLDAKQAAAIWEPAITEWREGSAPSAEIALLAGSLESLPIDIRSNLAARIAKAVASQPKNSALWKSLGRLLSRVLFHSGADQVLPPECVVAAWEDLGLLEIAESIQPEAAATWLRAARLTGLRPLDVPKPIRNQISSELKSWGITEVRRRILEEVVPIAPADQSGLLGESPPPGLSLIAS